MSPTAVGSRTTSYRPGGSSTGSAPASALAAAREPRTPPSTSDSRGPASRATPSAPAVRAMPSMLTSVVAPCATWPAELANAAVRYLVLQNPAVGSPPAASTNARTRPARSAGVAATMSSSTTPA